MLNIFTLTANKLAEHLKSGQLSSVEVCTQYIERIEKFEKETKHKNFIFSNGIDLIHEIFNFNKNSNNTNFNNFLKIIGKNKFFKDMFMKVADVGFRSY